MRLICECPSVSITTRAGTPCASSKEAAECRRSRNLIGIRPAAFSVRWKCRWQFRPSRGYRQGAQPALQAAGSDVELALGNLLVAAITSRAQGTWLRLKMCAADDCRWIFFDHSKPHSARWCATDVCGNRMKTRSYRARHRSPARGAGSHPRTNPMPAPL